MKVSKTILIFILFSLLSCNAQNEVKNDKIIALNELIQIFYQVNEINLDQLEERKINTGDESFEKLKTSISKESLNKKAILLFNENFNSKEIDELYEYSKKSIEQQQNLGLLDSEPNQFKINLSPELKNKKDSVYLKLFNEGYKVYQNFKHQLHVLDSINYDSSKNKSLKTGFNKKMNKVNGIYETLSFVKNQNTEIYLNSLILKEKPSLTYNNLKQIKISPQQGPGLFYSIKIVFNKEDSKKLSILSRNNIDKPLVIVVNEKIIIAPFVMDTIENGLISIAGNFSYDKAKTIVDNIAK